jgi:phage protein D
VTALLGALGAGTDRPVPAFSLRVGGLPLPLDAAADVVAVRAEQDVDLPGTFTLRLLDWDPALRRMTWSDSGLFEPGTSVDISFGYVGGTDSVLSGEVTGLELEIDGGSAPVVVVRGYDRRHRLMRGQLTRTFVGVTDSDIARRIGAERGLAVEATPTAVRHAHVLQHNQTDLEFLTQRAARIGYEVAMDDRTLLFRPRARPGVPTVVLRRDAELVSFFPRLTTMGQTSGVVVQGWDPARPDQQLRAVVGTDDAGASGSPTAAAGPAAGAVDVGNRTLLRPVADQAEATALAQALTGTTRPWRIEGEGTCIGRPDVRAGSPVRIDGLGTRFSGTYLVTSAAHTYSPGTGYRTHVRVRGEFS